MHLLRLLSIITAFIAIWANSVLGAEFQPIGTLGIGGAGVARMHDAYAAYWNPAGLAFNESSFSAKLNAGAGISINSTMAENIDRIGKLNIDNLRDLNITVTPTLNSAQIDQNLVFIDKAVQFVGVLNDLSHHEGTLSVNANAMLGFQFQHFATGGITTSEFAAFPTTDLNSIRPGGATTLTDFATGVGAATATRPTTTFFSDQQRDQITAAFGGNVGITNALETAITRPGGNQTNMTPEQARDAMVHMGQALTNNQGSLENNNSTVEYKGLILTDFPISYGHPINLGSFGKLGIGASLKLLWGRAFIGESKIVQVKDSGEIIKNITDHYNDSTNIGIDLGMLWQYSKLLSVGVVAKNINSPEFDSPQVALPVRGNTKETIRVKPQIRAGATVDPLPWLTIAADLDLTENETILQSSKSRNVGGGVEIHPFSWFKLRAGAYKNLAAGDIGPVGTLGLSFGTKWINLDIDGASAFSTGTYNNNSYPKEARLQLAFNMLF